MNEGYYLNKIGHYAYAYGFVKGVLGSERSPEEKLELITIEVNQLEERLQRLKEQQGE